VPRGELRRELLACQGKPQRGPGTANGGAGSATSSANAQRRWRVPGHWEGNLIKGNRSSVGTLVERTSRKLVKLANAKAETARDGFACWRCRRRCALP
jgi:IS30 family transposase